MNISARAYWRLTRWLGPWADGTRAPRAVARERLILEAHGSEGFTVEVLVYVPTDRPAIGNYLIARGLNPHGPEDGRCDRFARVLSHASFIVMCPRLSALTQMRLDATAIAELSLSLEALVALDEHPRHQLPGIFSVSFGSFPALMTAASPRVGHLVGNHSPTSTHSKGAIIRMNSTPVVIHVRGEVLHARARPQSVAGQAPTIVGYRYTAVLVDKSEVTIHTKTAHRYAWVYQWKFPVAVGKRRVAAHFTYSRHRIRPLQALAELHVERPEQRATSRSSR